MTYFRFFILFFLFLVGVPVFAAQPDVLFRENFDSLAQWEPLTFPKIKAHSTYTLVMEGGKSILKAESRASASALVHRRALMFMKTPVFAGAGEWSNCRTGETREKKRGTTIRSGSM